MESQHDGTRSSIGGKRKLPLSDCTNTVHIRSSTTSSSSSSSCSVLKKPFPVSFQFLDSQRHHASSSKSPIDVAQSATGSTTDNAVKKTRVSIPTSTVQKGLSIYTLAHPLPKPSAVVGGDDALVAFVRRQPGSRRKEKETPIDVSSTKSHSSNNVVIPPSTVPRSLLSTPAHPLAKQNISMPAHPLAKPSSDSGANDVSETSPVYVRRQSERKRNDNENPIDVPSTRSRSSNRVLIPLSAVQRSSISTPARPVTRPSSILGANDSLQPSPVYVRRQSGSKRKEKEKEKTIDMPATKIHSSSRDKTKKDGVINLSKPSGAPSIKAEKVAVKHTLPKDFIEKQKAYFAEIDAFDLSVEEVTAADDSE